jgi:hypothetical protein
VKIVEMTWILLASILILVLLTAAMYFYAAWCWRRWHQEVKAHAGTVANYKVCADQRHEYRVIADEYERRFKCGIRVVKESDEWPDEIDR